MHIVTEMAKRKGRITKIRITMMLDPETVSFFKGQAARPGAEPYQTQINRVLREHASGAAPPTRGVAEPTRRYTARVLSERARVRGQRTIKAVIRPGEQSGWVAECVEVPVVTQGATLDEVTANLREAVGLHLDGADLAALGLSADPTVVVTLELSPADA